VSSLVLLLLLGIQNQKRSPGQHHLGRPYGLLHVLGFVIRVALWLFFSPPILDTFPFLQELPPTFCPSAEPGKLTMFEWDFLTAVPPCCFFFTAFLHSRRVKNSSTSTPAPFFLCLFLSLPPTFLETDPPLVANHPPTRNHCRQNHLLGAVGTLFSFSYFTSGRLFPRFLDLKKIPICYPFLGSLKLPPFFFLSDLPSIPSVGPTCKGEFPPLRRHPFPSW